MVPHRDFFAVHRCTEEHEFETQYRHPGGQLKNRRFYDEKD